MKLFFGFTLRSRIDFAPMNNMMILEVSKSKMQPPPGPKPADLFTHI